MESSFNPVDKLSVKFYLNSGWIIVEVETEAYRIDFEETVSMLTKLMFHLEHDFSRVNMNERIRIRKEFQDFIHANQENIKIPEKEKEEPEEKITFETNMELITKKIQDRLHCITLHEKSESMLFFDRGIYRFQGETRVKEQCQKIIQECNTNKVNSTLDSIRRTSYLEREKLGVENNPHLVLSNCLFNIDTGLEESFDVCLKKEYYFLNKLHCTFNPDASCPKFLAFIQNALPEADVMLVQEILGAILRKWYFTKKLAVFTGPPNTGKTTLLSVFTTLLGQENVSSIPIQRFAKGDKFTLDSLFGKMANISDDLPKDSVRSIGILKQLTGLSLVQAEAKFGTPYSFVNYAFLLFACNDLPPINEDDEAFWDRMIQVDFTRPIPKDKINRNLLSELTTQEELSGILNWGLDGLRRLEKNGWNFSRNETKERARERYRQKSEPLEYFCLYSGIVESTGNEEDFITKDRFFSLFKQYCEGIGMEKVWSKVMINQEIVRLKGFDVESTHTGAVRIWRKIREVGLEQNQKVGSLVKEFVKLSSEDVCFGSDCEYCGRKSVATFKDSENRLLCEKCKKEGESN